MPHFHLEHALSEAWTSANREEGTVFIAFWVVVLETWILVRRLMEDRTHKARASSGCASWRQATRWKQ
jgi:hypothetical protein